MNEVCYTSPSHQADSRRQAHELLGTALGGRFEVISVLGFKLAERYDEVACERIHGRY